MDTICDVTYESYIGDGHCDSSDYNIASCNWDGGDCCEASCEDSADYSCGVDSSFNCKDPDLLSCNVDDQTYLGDGYCDSTGGYNTDICNWDEGDCCLSTCEDTNDHVCSESGFTCLDPDRM